MTLKKYIIFSVSIIIGILIFLTLRILYVGYYLPKDNFIPKNIKITLKPPTGAIVAKISQIDGSVKKESRNDTKFKSLKEPTTLVEGESLATENGSSEVSFNNIASLRLGTNTEIDYLNGLPDALVLRQPNGLINYVTSNNIKPFSIRSLGLLIQFNQQANATVSTNSDKGTVRVILNSGEITLAYSDSKNNTQVKILKNPQIVIFDNNASTLTSE